MRDHGRYVRAGLAGLCVIAIVAVAITRSGLFRQDPGERAWYEPVREGGKVFAAMPMVPVSSLRDPGTMTGLLDRGEWLVADEVPRERVAALRHALAEFLRMQFVEPDAEAYRQWQAARGCVLAPIEDLERRVQVLSEYEIIVGRPPPASPRVEDMYVEYWDAMRHAFEGSSVLTGLANEPRGLAARIQYASDPHNPGIMLGALLGDRLWYGPVAASMSRWFVPARTPKDLVARHGRVLMAEVGMVAEWRGERRRPLLLRWFFDPALGQWIIGSMNQNNFDPRDVTVAPLVY